MLKTKRPVFVTGLDIGSSKVSAVVARIDTYGSLTIVAQATLPSRGVARGVFVNMNEAIDEVGKVFAMIKDKTGMRPENIYVNISGENVKGAKSKGMVPLSLRGREVARLDIEKCMEAASTIHLPFEREIIHKIVQNFSIDDQPPIKDPLGLYASRLNCETYVITASVSHLENIYKCVNSAGYDIKEVVFTGMANSAVLVDKEEKEAGVVLLDIGASITAVTIFSNGVLAAMDIIPLGVNDMSESFKENQVFEDLLSRISEKIRAFTVSGGKVGSIVLTGGINFKDDAIEMLESRLSKQIKIGVIKNVRGDISSADNIKLTTAIGLCKYAQDVLEARLQAQKNIIQNVFTRVVDTFNNYF